MQEKVKANAKVNEPLTIFQRIIQHSDIKDLSASGSLFSHFMKINQGQSELSNSFGEVCSIL